MASIGDLVMRVVAEMKGFRTTVTKEATETGEQAGKNLSKGMTKGLKGKLSGAKGGILAGLGLGAGLGLVGLTTTAVSQLTDVVRDSIKAFNEDQVSQQKLATTLKANIPAWDGNTKAIEDVLAARTKLGFSDDEQRDSLATLATATGDVTKALDLQRGAMDLARSKGKSLAEVSDAVAKAYAGNAKGLKSLIPGLKVSKNAAVTLARAFGTAKNAAEDYTKTNEGKVEVAQVRVNEAMEKLGSILAGPVADATVTVANAIGDLAAAFDDLPAADGGENPFKGLADGLSDLANSFDPDPMYEAKSAIGEIDRAASDLISDLLDFATPWDEFMSAADQRDLHVDDIRETSRAVLSLGDASERMAAKATAAGEDAEGALDSVGDAAGDLAYDATEANDAIKRSYDSLVDSLVANARRLIDDFFGAVDAERQRYDAHVQTSASIEALAAAKTSSARRAAGRDIEDALQDQGRALLDLKDKNKLTAHDIDVYEQDMEDSYKALGKKVPEELRKVIAKLRGIESYDGAVVSIDFQARSGGSSSRAGIRASGGPVRKDMPYVVGERRPELFVPSVAGRIIPKVPSMAASADAAAAWQGGDTYNFTALPVARRSMDDLRHEALRISDVQRLRRLG